MKITKTVELVVCHSNVLATALYEKLGASPDKLLVTYLDLDTNEHKEVVLQVECTYDDGQEAPRGRRKRPTEAGKQGTKGKTKPRAKAPKKR